MSEKTFEEKMKIKDERNVQEPVGFDITKIEGLFETTTTIPTEPVTQLSQQIKIYVDSISSPTTKRLYIYSNKTKSWYYVALT